MENINTRKTNFFSKVLSRFDDFLYTKQYLIVLGVIAVLTHTLSIPLVGVAIYVFFSCFIFLYSKDITPFIPIACFAIYIFNTLSITANIWFFIIVSPVIICAVLHFFIFKSNNFYLGKMFAPLICVSVALFLGGINSIYVSYYLNGIVACFVFGPLLVLVYLLFRNYICPPKSYNLKDMIMLIIILSALVPTYEMFGAIKDIGFEKFRDYGNVLGWGSVNVIATMLVLSIPAVCYFISKTKFFLPYILLLAFVYLSIYATTSDGCLAIAFCMIIPVAIYTLSLTRKDKFNELFTIFLIVVLLGLIALLYLNKIGFIQKVINYLDKNIHDDNGRTPLYNKAVELFKSNPIFGVGLGYTNGKDGYEVGNLAFINFHSVFYHTLATMGIVGIISYGYLFFTRYSILMNNHSRFNVFITLCYSFMLCYALIDTAEFNILPCVIEMLIIFTTTEILNEKGEDELPLLYNHFDF